MRKLLPTLLGLLLPALALANGYDVPNVNPRDLAMAGSLVADQETSAAVFANPAALSKLEGLSLDMALNVLDNRTTWYDTTGGLSPSPVDTQVKPSPPPSLNIGYGTKINGHGFGVGLGFTILAGAHVFWPDGWPGQSRILTVDRKVYGFFLASGYEVVKGLRLGAGLVYYRTAEHLVQGADPALPGATAELSAAGGALSFDLSAEVKPFDDVPLTFGIDYKHQGVQTLTGEAHFANVPPAFQTSPRLQDQNVSHELTYPTAVNIGVAYRVAPPVLLAFGFTWNRYVVYQDDIFVGAKDPANPIVVPRNYGNGRTYRLGVEWNATERLKLRAGVLRDVSGMPRVDSAPGVSGLISPTYSPTLPDSNVWAGAIGAAYDITPALRVQATLWHAWFDEVSSSNTSAANANATGQPFPGRYQTQVWVYGGGFVYRWDPGR